MLTGVLAKAAALTAGLRRSPAHMHPVSLGTRVGRSSMALLVAAVGCLGPHRERATAAYVPRSSAARSSLDAAGRPFASIERALGLPSLSRVELPVRSRELRLSSSFSMLGSAMGLRLVEEAGRSPSGFLARVWSERAADSTPAIPRSRCTSWQDGSRDCVLVWTRAYDWRKAAADLASLGVWELADNCATDGRSFADAGDLYVDRLRGQSADSYYCNAPRFRTSIGGRHATRVLAYLDSLAYLIRTLPPDPPPT